MKNVVLTICCLVLHDITFPLKWRHNERNVVSNNQPHDCLLNRLIGRRSKKHQSSASLVFVRGIHCWPVNSPHKGPLTRKMFLFDVVVMHIQVFGFSIAIKYLITIDMLAINICIGTRSMQMMYMTIFDYLIFACYTAETLWPVSTIYH